MAKPARAVPAGLDTLTADDMKLMDAMRNETEAPPAAAEPEPAPEPEPAKVAAPEPAAIEEAPDAEDEPEVVADPKARTVPQQALHAEREKRKAAEKAFNEAQVDFAAKQARAQERLDMLAAAMQAAATPATPVPAAEIEVPDVNTDPVGHFRAVAQQQAKSVDDLKAIITSMQEGQQQQQQRAELQSWTADQERAFAAKEPTYLDAVKWMMDSRDLELQKIGITDPVERRRIMQNDFTTIAQKARKDGASPAERLYGAAEARGFKKAAPPPATAPAAVVIPPLDAPVVDPGARIESGRENALTLGSLGAAPPSGKLSVDKLISMSDADFAKITGKMSQQQLRELMGN